MINALRSTTDDDEAKAVLPPEQSERVFRALATVTEQLKAAGIHPAETGLLMIGFGALQAEKNLGTRATRIAIESVRDLLVESSTVENRRAN